MKTLEFNENTAREVTADCHPGAKIVTRDKRPARVICWNAKGERPIVALVDMGGFEVPYNYNRAGRRDPRENVSTNHDLLIEMPGDE